MDDEALLEATASFKKEAAKRRADHDKWAAAVRLEVEHQIAAKAKAMEQAIEEARHAGDDALDAREKARDAAVAAAAAAREEERRRLDALRNGPYAVAQQRVAEIRAQRENSAAARALHEQAKRFDTEAEALKAEADRLTAALEGLDKYRRRLASELPIEGLEIEGREIRVNGVPYSQLNTAQRVDIAVRVACLRAQGQRLPVVFVDGAEALDKDHFDLLVARLAEAHVQAFVGRVEDGDLRVVADGVEGGG